LDGLGAAALGEKGAFAEFERSLLCEQQREGIVRSCQRGACRGRKRSLSADHRHEAPHLSDAGQLVLPDFDDFKRRIL
jgi:hypothetical protein